MHSQLGHRTRRTAVMLAVVGALTIAGLLPAGLGTYRADALATPHVTLSVTTGTVGTSVVAVGTNFKANSAITVWVRTFQVGSTKADANGRASATFKFPAVIGGRSAVTFKGDKQVYSAFFNTIPGLWVSPRSVAAGGSVRFVVRGFQGYERVIFSWSDGTRILVKTTNLNGEASGTVALPVKAAGGYKVYARGSVVSKATAVLQIT